MIKQWQQSNCLCIFFRETCLWTHSTVQEAQSDQQERRTETLTARIWMDPLLDKCTCWIRFLSFLHVYNWAFDNKPVNKPDRLSVASLFIEQQDSVTLTFNLSISELKKTHKTQHTHKTHKNTHTHTHMHTHTQCPCPCVRYKRRCPLCSG